MFFCSFQGNSPNFLRPCDQGKRQLKDMKFWNWGPTIIWHNLGCVAFYFSKSLHPTKQQLLLVNFRHTQQGGVILKKTTHSMLCQIVVGPLFKTKTISCHIFTCRRASENLTVTLKGKKNCTQHFLRLNLKQNLFFSLFLSEN